MSKDRLLVSSFDRLRTNGKGTLESHKTVRADEYNKTVRAELVEVQVACRNL